MIRFYALPVSGYCTKVRIVLRIKGLAYTESPPIGGHYSSEAWQRAMPPGSIPALEHDGLKLFDSEAIVEYLEDICPTPAMRSADPALRARQRAIAQYHNTRLEPTVRALFPLVKSAAADTAALDNAAAAFHQALDKLLPVVEPDPFIGGETPCLADCGYPATLHMGVDILRHLGRQAELPRPYADWLAALDGHPVIAEEVAANRQAVAEWLAQF